MTRRNEGEKRRRAPGKGFAEQLPNGRWRGGSRWAECQDGKRKLRSVSKVFDTQREALAFAREMVEQREKGVVMPTGKADIKELLETWLEGVKSRVATHTHTGYKQHVDKLLVPYLGKVGRRDLNAMLIEAAYAKMEADGVSRKMIRKAAVTLGVALQDAVRLRILPGNPARDARKPKVEQASSTEIKAMTPEQVRAFLAAAKDDAYYPMWVLWFEAGLRPGEVYGLHWSEVDWDRRTIQVLRSLEESKGHHTLKDLKTGKSRRLIAINQTTLDALNGHRQAMLRQGRDVVQGPCFTDSRGGFLRTSNVQRRHFNKILKAAGLNHFRPYDVRHTMATLMLLAGVNVKVVSERLGHATVRLTLDTYQHVIPGMQEDAAARLEALINPPERKAVGSCMG